MLALLESTVQGATAPTAAAMRSLATWVGLESGVEVGVKVEAAIAVKVMAAEETDQ